MSVPYQGKSNTKATAGIAGSNTKGGDGVWGEANASPNPGRGVVGVSDTGVGLWGDTETGRAVVGVVRSQGDAVWGESKSGRGVVGVSEDQGSGVWGVCDTGVGVHGESKAGRGIHGASDTGSGVFGQSSSGRAIEGWSNTNYGVTGDSQTFPGVRGSSVKGRGVEGWSTDAAGIFGMSIHDVGVHGKGGKLAGLFEGDVEVTGDIRMTNADCAEDFDIAETDSIEPGTVMVLSDEGALRRSDKPYDKRVAGVVSGAGGYRPGLVLDRHPTAHRRQPIALLGKAFCKVDARFGPIRVGDLLTTSPELGCAMRADDPVMAFGAVIGKALRPLTDGQGLIPILIALQ